ncbi:UNVERIFIED_ORG: hypothetical protein J2W85_004844 [Ensifer adhaerens]|nr:hypothetical protein [Ensifer adhaerens]
MEKRDEGPMTRHARGNSEFADLSTGRVHVSRGLRQMSVYVAEAVTRRRRHADVRRPDARTRRSRTRTRSPLKFMDRLGA